MKTPKNNYEATVSALELAMTASIQLAHKALKLLKKMPYNTLGEREALVERAKAEVVKTTSKQIKRDVIFLGDHGFGYIAPYSIPNQPDEEVDGAHMTKGNRIWRWI